jgi:hypothetical protein
MTPAAWLRSVVSCDRRSILAVGAMGVGSAMVGAAWAADALTPAAADSMGAGTILTLGGTVGGGAGLYLGMQFVRAIETMTGLAREGLALIREAFDAWRAAGFKAPTVHLRFTHEGRVDLQREDDDTTQGRA